MRRGELSTAGTSVDEDDVERNPRGSLSIRTLAMPTAQSTSLRDAANAGAYPDAAKCCLQRKAGCNFKAHAADPFASYWIKIRHERATSRTQTHAPQQRASVENLVSTAGQRQRNCNAERPSRFHVDVQLDFGSLLDRQVGRFFALQVRPA